MVITPHYTGTDPQALADKLRDQLTAVTSWVSVPTITINVYLATGAPPHHPLASSVHTGAAATSVMPREVAICLSYYATLNQPRLRGRVYLPAPIMGMASGIRPAPGDLPRALNFGPALFKTLPAGHVPVVFSRVAGTSAPITNYWVDNEWDTVRSRGLISTTRSVGTVP